jgi:hypothetical protein
MQSFFPSDWDTVNKRPAPVFNLGSFTAADAYARLRDLVDLANRRVSNTFLQMQNFAGGLQTTTVQADSVQTNSLNDLSAADLTETKQVLQKLNVDSDTLVISGKSQSDQTSATLSASASSAITRLYSSFIRSNTVEAKTVTADSVQSPSVCGCYLVINGRFFPVLTSDLDIIPFGQVTEFFTILFPGYGIEVYGQDFSVLATITNNSQFVWHYVGLPLTAWKYRLYYKGRLQPTIFSQ